MKLAYIRVLILLGNRMGGGNVKHELPHIRDNHGVLSLNRLDIVLPYEEYTATKVAAGVG
jgi:hypothetical protein